MVEKLIIVKRSQKSLIKTYKILVRSWTNLAIYMIKITFLWNLEKQKKTIPFIKKYVTLVIYGF